MSDRILVTGATGLQGSEMGSEKFSNSAKSGYNKGTIRTDIWYLVVSKDVRRHRLISISYISQGPCHGRSRGFEARGSHQLAVGKRQRSRVSFVHFVYRHAKLPRYTRSHAISGVSNNCYACSADLPYSSPRLNV